MKTKGAMKNLNNTSYLLAFFTTVWAIFMLVWLILRSPLPLLPAIAVTAFFVAVSVYIYLSAIAGHKALKAIPDDENTEEDSKKSKKWTAVFIVQASAISLSSALLGSFGLFEYIVIAVLFIVGLHYIPISMFYRTKIQIYVAVPTILLAVLGLASLLTGTLAEYASGICSFAGALGCAVLGFWAIAQVKAFTSRPDSQK
ncbi:MAG: hypothetical protein LBC78_01255 [Oscillospiraceae bacterium]|jgi:hypothetical protein|nr:hypothetical protein [Oscillospiraceae bacterium]